MSISEYTQTRLWQPMGAEGVGSWSLDSEQSGFEKTFADLNGRAIDLVKLGCWLFLKQGSSGAQQVVSAAWVDAATRPDADSDPAARYEY